MLSYGGLSTFYSGLEGIVGSPDPNVLEAMKSEHTARPDSNLTFTAGNYGVSTTSATEWGFVTDPDRGEPRGGWPRETKNATMQVITSEGVVSQVTVARTPIAKQEMLGRMRMENVKLQELGEPELGEPEAIGARMYTGPCFFKYNSVLRGRYSDVEFLRKQMLELCCSVAVYKEYASSVVTPRQLEGGGVSKAFEKARAAMNTYATSLHAINSAIVKLSKLTYACKVYRGVNGRVLPEQFWRANEYGVRGGIEGAFMSTTVDREVAMSYAQGSAVGSSTTLTPGFIFEIQQGMVDRGANLTWLSQYPHEQEIVFAPLAGFEVKYTRVEGQVLVVVVGLSVNLTAQTIEQVIEKRKKLVSDMCEQLIVSSKQTAATSDEWGMLREVMGDVAIDAADRFLRSMQLAITAEKADHYNDNSKLLVAIDEAVGVANAVDGWSEGMVSVLGNWSGQEKERKTAYMLLNTPTLELPHRGLDVSAAFGLAATLYLSDTLTEINVGDNPLTDAGVAAIGMALSAKPLPVLRELTLSNTGAGERAALVMTALIETHPTLRKLNLRQNPGIALTLAENKDAGFTDNDKDRLVGRRSLRAKSGLPNLLLIL